MQIPKFLKPKNWHMASFGLIFILIGAVGLLYPLISSGLIQDTVFLDAAARYHNQNFSPYVSGNTVVSTPQTTINPNRPSIKDRLIMSSGKIDLALFESTNANALLKGGWVFPNTSTPVLGGNTVIFAHRFRYLPPISNTLYNLDKVKMGDKFTIVWKGINYDYQVTQIKIIDPTDLSVLSQDKENQITIITCWPLYSSKQRLMVIGKHI